MVKFAIDLVMVRSFQQILSQIQEKFKISSGSSQKLLIEVENTIQRSKEQTVQRTK